MGLGGPLSDASHSSNRIPYQTIAVRSPCITLSLRDRPSRVMPSFSITRQERVLRTSAVAETLARPSSRKIHETTAPVASDAIPLPQWLSFIEYPIVAVLSSRWTFTLMWPITASSITVAKDGCVCHESSIFRAISSSACFRV